MNTVIRTARLAKGYSQTELARIIGVTAGAVSQWEKGRTMPSIHKLNVLADALGITVQEIIGSKGRVEKAG